MISTDNTNRHKAGGGRLLWRGHRTRARNQSQAGRAPHQCSGVRGSDIIHDRFAPHRRRRAVHGPCASGSQVVTAIGFIGAGVILQSRGSITGLTTAATILVVGALGVTIGEGMFTVAAMTTILIIVVLVVLRKIESAFISRRRLFKYQLKTTDISDSLTRLHVLLESEGLRLDDFSVLDLSDGRHELRFGVVTSLATNNRLIKLLPEIGTEVQGATAAD